MQSIEETEPDSDETISFNTHLKSSNSAGLNSEVCLQIPTYSTNYLYFEHFTFKLLCCFAFYHVD